jgi:hypothetical protein
MVAQPINNNSKNYKICCSEGCGCNYCGGNSEGCWLGTPNSKDYNTLTASKMECLEAGYGMTIASRSIPKPHPLQQGQRSEAATTFGNELIGRDELLGRESSARESS